MSTGLSLRIFGHLASLRQVYNCPTITPFGETEFLATHREVDDAVKRIEQELDKAAVKAKKAIKLDLTKGVYN